MTSPDPLERVVVLLPARVHQARRQAADELRAELAALIAALPTVSSLPAGDASAELAIEPATDPE